MRFFFDDDVDQDCSSVKMLDGDSTLSAGLGV